MNIITELDSLMSYFSYSILFNINNIDPCCKDSVPFGCLIFHSWVFNFGGYNEIFMFCVLWGPIFVLSIYQRAGFLASRMGRYLGFYCSKIIVPMRVLNFSHPCQHLALMGFKYIGVYVVLSCNL